jgi:hypothetical protein
MGIFAITLSSVSILISIPLIQTHLKTNESKQAIFMDCISRQIISPICTDLYLQNPANKYAGH